MTRRISIFDTTLRDGAQSVGISFSLEDKLKIAAALDEFGIDYIEGGWPGSNPKDIAFFQAFRSWKFKHARLCAFSSTKLKNIAIETDANIQTLIAAETPVATIFGKSWDLHVTEALETTPEENLDMIFTTVRYLKSYFDEVIFDAEHFFDGFRFNPEYALQTLHAAAEGGCDWLVLCDTNGGSHPHEVTQVMEMTRRRFNIPLGIHAHNDGEMAVANSLAAALAGADMIQGTVNGLGERCGNANLCSIIPGLALKMDISSIPVENVKNLKPLACLVSELSNKSLPDNLPYVGGNAFAHKAGIHVSAVLKNPRTYEHVPPEMVGNARCVSVSELSGKCNIQSKIMELGLAVGNDAGQARDVLKKIKKMEAEGYHFEGADASFELLVRSLSGQLKEYFRLEGYRVMTWKNADGLCRSEATIKAGVPDAAANEHGIAEPIEHTSADGRGPVEALDKALRKVFEKFYPSLKEVKLSDYKVRILDEGSGTGAITRVLIHSTDNTRYWGTVGVSADIIDASWQALADALIYKLVKDEEAIKLQKKMKEHANEQFQNQFHSNSGQC